jgi:outer membrane receptor for ferrienterochelin and colicins
MHMRLLFQRFRRYALQDIQGLHRRGASTLTLVLALAPRLVLMPLLGVIVCAMNIFVCSTTLLLAQSSSASTPPPTATSTSPASPASGTITGVVTDGETGDVLAGAVVRVEARELGAVANKDGIYVVRNVPAGTATLLVNFIGYETRKIKIFVRAGESLTQPVALKSQMLRTSDVVVSAGKRVQAAQDVPISISTVGQREIQQRGITTVDQALRYVPGVNVNRDQISVRGSSGFSLGFGSRVGIFLDGFPLLSGDGGDIKFDALPMFNVERIEVVKGAGSALYGTGAIGGVVNIFTQAPSEQPDFRLRASGGAYTLPRFEEWRWRSTPPFVGNIEAGYSQKFGALGVLVSGGFRRNEGHQDYFAGNQYSALAKLSYDFAGTFPGQTRMNLLANYALEERTNWVFWRSLRQATLPFANANRDETFASRKLMVAADLRHIFSEGFFMTARAGFFNTDFNTITPGNVNNSNINSAANSYNIEAQFTSVLDSTLLATYGVNGTLNQIVQSPIITSSAQRNIQTIIAAYAQAEWKPLGALAGLTLTAGSRFDVEQTGSLAASGVIVSPKLGVSWAVSSETQLRGSFGGGFRAPTIAERYAALRFSTFTVLPNEALQSERSWSGELGARHSFQLFDQDWSLDGAVFQNEFVNLIEPILPANVNMLSQPIQFRNVPQARVQGAELALNGWLPGKIVGFETSVTGMYPLDVQQNLILKYRPTVLWYSRLILPFGSQGAFQLQADYRFQSRVERIDDIIGVAINDADARVPVHVLDARVIANLFQLAGLPVVLTLNVRNALDYYYTEIMGNLAPTRSIALQVDLKL